MDPRAWRLAGLLMLAGCNGGRTPADASTPSDAVIPTVELGTGQTYWQDIPATGRVQLIHGPQGGYHVFGRVRLQGFNPDVYVSFRVTPAGGGGLINTEQAVHRVDTRGLVQTGAGYESTAPELVILTQVTDPSQVLGMHFTLETTVRESVTGRTASTSRDILIEDNPLM